MSFLRNPGERLADTLVLASIVVMASALAAHYLFPPRTAAGTVAGRNRTRTSLETDIRRADETLSSARRSISERTLTGDPESVTGGLLAQWTRRARQAGVELGAFRPQRTRTVAGLMELPATVQLTGSWPKVLALVREAERPGGRIAVRSIQVATSDAASDGVTVTVGFSAFIAPKSASAERATEVARGGNAGD